MTDQTEWIAPDHLIEQAIKVLPKNSQSVSKVNHAVADGATRNELIAQNIKNQQKLKEMLK